MTVRNVRQHANSDGGLTIDFEANGIPIAIEIYPGLIGEGETEWKADIRFSDEVLIGGGGPTQRDAVRFAAARQPESGVTLPTIDWSAVLKELDRKGIFRT